MSATAFTPPRRPSAKRRGCVRLVVLLADGRALWRGVDPTGELHNDSGQGALVLASAVHQVVFHPSVLAPLRVVVVEFTALFAVPAPPCGPLHGAVPQLK